MTDLEFAAAWDKCFLRVSRTLGAKYNIRSEDLEDVMSEAKFKAYRSKDRFREASAFGTWVFKIAANEWLAFIRKRLTSNEVSIDNPEWGELIRKADTVVNTHERDDEIRHLRKLVRALPHDSKKLANLNIREAVIKQHLLGYQGKELEKGGKAQAYRGLLLLRLHYGLVAISDKALINNFITKNMREEMDANLLRQR